MSSNVKEAIEEMIEESYLLGLSEKEVRQDFKRFIDTCYVVIQQNVHDRQAVNSLAESLAREQTVILITDRAEAPAAADDTDAGTRSCQGFSEKVARRKRQILRTIAKVDPRLVRLIDEQRFQGEVEELQRPVLRHRHAMTTVRRLGWPQVQMTMLKVGYATTVALIVFLIWLGFMQKS